jgi:uncharacterized protein
VTLSGSGRRAIATALAFLGLLVACAPPARAPAPDASGPQFPALTGRVVDGAQLLSDTTERQLTADLADLERHTRHQVVVVTIPSLQGAPIERFACRLVSHWGIGRRGVNDGVVFLTAPNEHRVRIEVGDGLTRNLTDPEAAAILRRDVLPHFRASDYETGIAAGTRAIISRVRLAPTTPQPFNLPAPQPPPWPWPGCP